MGALQYIMYMLLSQVGEVLYIYYSVLYLVLFCVCYREFKSSHPAKDEASQGQATRTSSVTFQLAHSPTLSTLGLPKFRLPRVLVRSTGVWFRVILSTYMKAILQSQQ